MFGCASFIISYNCCLCMRCLRHYPLQLWWLPEIGWLCDTGPMGSCTAWFRGRVRGWVRVWVRGQTSFKFLKDNLIHFGACINQHCLREYIEIIVRIRLETDCSSALHSGIYRYVNALQHFLQSGKFWSVWLKWIWKINNKTASKFSTLQKVLYIKINVMRADYI